MVTLTKEVSLEECGRRVGKPTSIIEPTKWPKINPPSHKMFVGLGFQKHSIGFGPCSTCNKFGYKPISFNFRYRGNVQKYTSRRVVRVSIKRR